MITRRGFVLAAAAGAAAAKNYSGIRFRQLSHGKSSRRYLWIHENETTAGSVLAAHMKRFNGKAWLVQSPTRVIKTLTLQFDPNRMFNDDGLDKNLRRLNPQASQAERAQVIRTVAKDREKFLAEITPPGDGLLIVLHNNARGYSVNDEIPISAAVSLKAPGEPNDFFLCTRRSDFDKIQSSPYNAVLQDEPRGDEDGSLSRTMGRRYVRYINLETAIGRADKQREMIEWLESNLP